MPSVLSDRYELGRVVGRGGMAEVREAQDLRLSRRVAVKILHASLADDPAFIERFRREATAVAALNHPGLVGIYDAGSDGEGDDAAVGNGEVTETQPDGTTVAEPAPQATADAPAPPADATTTAPGTDATAELAAVDQAVAEVTAEADGALAAGEIDQSARDNLVDKVVDAADKARSGDDDALDQVESLREDLEDLRDDGDLTPPTFNRLRRAVDSLEGAITAVL
jgi:hypothetical protein